MSESLSLEHIERQLASHIRNPDKVSGPEGMEPRRLKIYQDLFYNNIEGFISGGFPMLRQLMDDDSWHVMVRDFMVSYRCHSPYFLEISQEFLLYLQNVRVPQTGDLPFMLELAHYEWVELALDVADEDISEIAVSEHTDWLSELPIVSPLAWSLSYHYPVHKIGSDFQPDKPSAQPTFLVVYRDRNDRVGFMEINAVTARLLELLQDENAVSGEQVLQQLAQDMQHPHLQQIIDSGIQIFQQLTAADILLGSSLQRNSSYIQPAII